MSGYLMQLRSAGVRIEEELPLSAYSTFRIGGNARAAAFPESREQLLTVLRTAVSEEERFVLVGKGSNVLFSDRGYDGLVIFTTGCRNRVREGNDLRICAGAALSAIAQAACDGGLGGAEFAYGIPGTVGGAVCMNAGAYEGAVEQICISSDYFDTVTGKVGTFTGAEQKFGYRNSIYLSNPRYVVIGAVFRLIPDDPKHIRERMETLMARRKNSQPLEYPSAGSVFKRPEGFYAGRLIEECGLKGTTVGGAQVSEKHAGFIVNRGGATAEDVKRLIVLIQNRVLSVTGVRLECEIRMIE